MQEEKGIWASSFLQCSWRSPCPHWRAAAPHWLSNPEGRAAVPVVLSTTSSCGSIGMGSCRCTKPQGPPRLQWEHEQTAATVSTIPAPKQELLPCQIIGWILLRVVLASFSFSNLTSAPPTAHSCRLDNLSDASGSSVLGLFLTVPSYPCATHWESLGWCIPVAPLPFQSLFPAAACLESEVLQEFMLSITFFSQNYWFTIQTAWGQSEQELFSGSNPWFCSSYWREQVVVRVNVLQPFFGEELEAVAACSAPQNCCGAGNQSHLLPAAGENGNYA